MIHNPTVLIVLLVFFALAALGLVVNSMRPSVRAKRRRALILIDDVSEILDAGKGR